MSSDAFTALLNAELDHIAKRRNTALARGLWVKAIECDAQEEIVNNLKKKLNQENQNATHPAPSVSG